MHISKTKSILTTGLARLYVRVGLKAGCLVLYDVRKIAHLLLGRGLGYIAAEQGSLGFDSGLHDSP
jgi:hypothetical protein